MPGFPVSLAILLGSASGVLRTGVTQNWPAPLSTTEAAPQSSFTKLTSLHFSVVQAMKESRQVGHKCGHSCRSQLAAYLGSLVPFDPRG